MTVETSQFQKDLERARWDIPFFSERFLGIKMHPGQVRMAEAVLARSKARPWSPAYYDIWISAGNRAGKTLGLAIIVMHSCIFKAGIKPPTNAIEAGAWRTRPYLWYHFGPSQLVANKLHYEIEMILGGTHPAQHGLGCPLTKELPQVATTDKKFEGEYRWVVFDQILGGAEIHFRTASEKATSSLGQDMQGESLDEAGFQPELLWVYKNVMHLRRLGTGGQIIGISTPEEGHTEFSDLWQEGDPNSPDRKQRSISMRMSTRDNVGFGIDARTFEELTEGMDDDFVKQNIDGFFIQGRAAYFGATSVDDAFVDDLPEMQPARHGRVYIQAVDPGLKDKCWSLVFDIQLDGQGEPMLTGVKAEFARERTVESIIGLAANNHHAYDVKSDKLKSECYTAIDHTAFGGHMFRDLLLEAVPYVHPVEFGGSIQKKRKLLGDLKTLLEKHRIRMPRKGAWLLVRRQLLGYKTSDRSIEQDAVATLMVLGHEVRRTPVGGTASATTLDWWTPAGAAVKPRPNFRKRRRRRVGV